MPIGQTRPQSSHRQVWNCCLTKRFHTLRST